MANMEGRDIQSGTFTTHVTETTTWEDVVNIKAHLWLDEHDERECDPFIKCILVDDLENECALSVRLSDALIEYVIDNTGGDEPRQDADALLRRIFHHIQQQLIEYLSPTDNT